MKEGRIHGEERRNQLHQLLVVAKRKWVTAESLAEALEIDKRTLYRDIAKLRRIGDPILGEKGRGYRWAPGDPLAETGNVNLISGRATRVLPDSPLRVLIDHTQARLDRWEVGADGFSTQQLGMLHKLCLLADFWFLAIRRILAPEAPRSHPRLVRSLTVVAAEVIKLAGLRVEGLRGRFGEQLFWPGSLLSPNERGMLEAMAEARDALVKDMNPTLVEMNEARRRRLGTLLAGFKKLCEARGMKALANLEGSVAAR